MAKKSESPLEELSAAIPPMPPARQTFSGLELFLKRKSPRHHN